MRVVKSLSKQKELANLGRLWIIANGRYVSVTPEECEQMQGVRFYTKPFKD